MNETNVDNSFVTRRKLLKLLHWYRNKRFTIQIDNIHNDSMLYNYHDVYRGIIKDVRVVQDSIEYPEYDIYITFENGTKEEFTIPGDANWFSNDSLGFQTWWINSGPTCEFNIKVLYGPDWNNKKDT